MLDAAKIEIIGFENFLAGLRKNIKDFTIEEVFEVMVQLQAIKETIELMEEEVLEWNNKQKKK